MATKPTTMTVAEAGRLGGRQTSAAKRAATRESLKAARAAKAEKAAERKVANSS